MHNQGIRAFPSSTVVKGKRLVQLSANGNVSHNSATADNKVVGVSQYGTKADEDVSVKLMNHSGTQELTTAGAIDAGSYVYAAAAGKIDGPPSGAGTYRKIGIALQQATAEDDVIEVLPFAGEVIETLT